MDFDIEVEKRSQIQALYEPFIPSLPREILAIYQQHKMYDLSKNLNDDVYILLKSLDHQ